MRIAVWHNLPSGGGKRALYDHVRGLAARGHYVESWRPSTADQKYLPLGDVVTEHILPLKWPAPPANLVTKVAYAYHDTLRRIKLIDEHCHRCAIAINRGGFDLLFSGACAFFRATSIGRYVQGPKVLYLQEPYRPLYEAMPLFGPKPMPIWAAPDPPRSWLGLPRYAGYLLYNLFKVQGYRAQVREEVRNAGAYDSILANSYYSRESILRAYGLDAKVCYLGVDTGLFRRDDDAGEAQASYGEREDMVMGIGAFVYEKNIEFVLEALSKVAQPRPSLVWIGNVAIPSYLETLERKAHALGVKFAPRLRVEDREVVDTLRRAKMLVYAPRLEPFGFAPLEANACGLPVVAVAEGGVRETVEDGVTGLLVDPDPRAMAGAIQRLLADPGYAARLGEGGRKAVNEKWTLDSAIDRLEGMLVEISEQARAGMKL